MKYGKYRHYKGKDYEVVGVALHTETLEELVVYKSLYENEQFALHQLWVRPKSMFLEQVVHEGSLVPRFKWVGD
jgi:hypothetical protein